MNLIRSCADSCLWLRWMLMSRVFWYFLVFCNRSNSFRKKTNKKIQIKKRKYDFHAETGTGPVCVYFKSKRFPDAEHLVFLLSHFKGCALSRLSCGTLCCFLVLGFASPTCQFNCMAASHWRLWQLSYLKLHTAS